MCIRDSYNYANKYHIASVWRDDWLKKVGIDKIPETLDEAETAFYKFRNDDPDGNGPVSYTHLDVYKRQAIRCGYTAAKI